ncbi:hypothetical protein JCM5296_005771 [Sporobolomyces johnsonii]
MSWLGSIFGPQFAQPSSGDPPPPSAELASTSPEPQPATKGQGRDSVKVAVLLDGDADFFTDAYLSKGYRGGRSAALDLRNKVHHLVIGKEKAAGSTGTPEVNILAMTFLNMSGLSNFLQCDLRSFSQGFNSSPFAFSMCDVGSQPQAADEAIKSHLPFCLSTCDYVLLGGSHDGGYAQSLLRLDPVVLHEKVFLLRTTPFCAERILELGLEEVRFVDLFDGRDPTRGKPKSTAPSRPLAQHSASASSISLPTSTARPPRSTSPSKRTAPAPAAPALGELTRPFPHTQSTPAVPSAGGSQKTQYSTEAAVTTLPARAPFALAVAALQSQPASLPSSALHSRQAPASSPHSHSPPPHISPLPLTSAASPHRATQGQLHYDFRPLVSLLKTYLSRGQPRALRADIGKDLKTRYPALYDSFSAYSVAAAKAGVVRLGKGEKVGQDWVELVHTTGPVNASGREREASKEGELSGLMEGLSLNGTAAAEAPAATASTSSIQPVSSPAPSFSDSNGTSRAPSTTPAPPPSAPAPVRAPWSSSSDFRPLLALLLAQLSSTPPRAQPLRSYVGEKLARSHTGLYANFKQYCEEAEREGLVRMGRGEVFGADYIELADPVEARKRVEAPEPPAANSAAASPWPPSHSPRPASLPPSSASARFLPLIQAIHAQPFPAPHWTAIGALLNRLRPRPYEEGGFKAYVQDAEHAGVIETGEVRGKENCYWMRLTPAMQNLSIPSVPAAFASPPSASPKPPASAQQTRNPSQSLTPARTDIPPRFLPLLQALKSSPFERPLRSQVGAELSKIRPRPYTEWKAYITEAEGLGLVKLGDGLTLPSSSPSSMPPTTVPASASSSRSPHPLSRPETLHSAHSNFTPPSMLPPSRSHSQQRSLPDPAATVPAAILARWRTLAPLHPFAPLVLVLRFLRESLKVDSPGLGKVGEYLVLAGGDAGLEGVFAQAGGAGEGLFGYVARAQRAGVVSVGEDGVRLKSEWEGWNGK